MSTSQEVPKLNPQTLEGTGSEGRKKVGKKRGERMRAEQIRDIFRGHGLWLITRGDQAVSCLIGERHFTLHFSLLAWKRVAQYNIPVDVCEKCAKRSGC